jgi:hypothetical protein
MLPSPHAHCTRNNWFLYFRKAPNALSPSWQSFSGVYGLNYEFAYACFYDTSMGHYTWYLVPCIELSLISGGVHAFDHSCLPFTFFPFVHFPNGHIGAGEVTLSHFVMLCLAPLCHLAWLVARLSYHHCDESLNGRRCSFNMLMYLACLLLSVPCSHAFLVLSLLLLQFWIQPHPGYCLAAATAAASAIFMHLRHPVNITTAHEILHQR